MKIVELNFMYLYRHCEEMRFNMTIYANKDIEDITLRDFEKLLSTIIESDVLAIDDSTLLFDETIENVLLLDETELTERYSSDYLTRVRFIKEIKSVYIELLNNYKTHDFINIFDYLITKISFLSECIEYLTTQNSLCDDEDVEDNEDIINMFF